jgi:hypothetical protein
MPHQKRAFVVEGGTATGTVTITGNVPAAKTSEPDRLKPQ